MFAGLGSGFGYAVQFHFFVLAKHWLEQAGYFDLQIRLCYKALHLDSNRRRVQATGSFLKYVYEGCNELCV